MSLLIRAGLLSRAAAIGAVNDLNRVFIDGREMAEWLRSNEVTVLTDTGQWPTPATAEIWRVFRSDVLSGGIEKWRSNVWQHQLTTVAELELLGMSRRAAPSKMRTGTSGSRHQISGRS